MLFMLFILLSVQVDVETRADSFYVVLLVYLKICTNGIDADVILKWQTIISCLMLASLLFFTYTTSKECFI